MRDERGVEPGPEDLEVLDRTIEEYKRRKLDPNEQHYLTVDFSSDLITRYLTTGSYCKGFFVSNGLADGAELVNASLKDRTEVVRFTFAMRGKYLPQKYECYKKRIEFHPFDQKQHLWAAWIAACGYMISKDAGQANRSMWEEFERWHERYTTSENLKHE